MKKKNRWEDVLISFIFWGVMGWIIFSIASCTAKTNQARFHMMENMKGTAVW